MTRLDLLLGSFNWDNFVPLEKLRTFKLCIKSAAFYSRDVLFFSEPNDSECQRQVLESISRAVWRNDRKLARKLLDVSNLAAFFIEIKQGKVVPLDPVAFEQVYAVEKLNHLKSQQAQLRAQIPHVSVNKQKQLKSKIQASRRLQSVWFPKQRRLRLAGLRLQDHSSGDFYVASGPEEIQGGLKKYWGLPNF